jgi:hypothetical protein
MDAEEHAEHALLDTSVIFISAFLNACRTVREKNAVTMDAEEYAEHVPPECSVRMGNA